MSEKKQPGSKKSAEQMEQEHLTRRQALRKFGFGAGLSAAMFLSADDLAHIIGTGLQKRLQDNNPTDSIAKNLQEAGVALADSPSSIDVTDAVTGGVGATISAWTQAVQTNGTSDQIAEYGSSVNYTYVRLTATDALYYSTDTSDEYYNDVVALQQYSQCIKAKLHGDLILASMQSSVTNISVGGGRYFLNVNPTASTFTLYDGTSNQTILATNNLNDLKPYLTDNDITSLAYSVGVLDTNGDVANYSSAALSSVLQAGDGASIALTQAEQKSLSSLQQTSPIQQDPTQSE